MPAARPPIGASGVGFAESGPHQSPATTRLGCSAWGKIERTIALRISGAAYNLPMGAPTAWQSFTMAYPASAVCDCSPLPGNPPPRRSHIIRRAPET
jgi:hypothetical protein